MTCTCSTHAVRPILTTHMMRSWHVHAMLQTCFHELPTCLHHTSPHEFFESGTLCGQNKTLYVYKTYAKTNGISYVCTKHMLKPMENHTSLLNRRGQKKDTIWPCKKQWKIICVDNTYANTNEKPIYIYTFVFVFLTQIH